MRTPNLRRTLLLGLLCLSAAVHAETADKVLIVVSGEGRDQGKTRPGFEMDEFSQAYLIFRDNGLDVDVASPRGGAVEADKYDATAPFNARLLQDAEAVRMLAETRATSDVQADDYAAVYVVGGKGAMFDLPADPALRGLLSAVYDADGIVAAVCHGPAALLDVRLDDGTLLVAGKAMTGFSNEEEALFGKRWAKEFPFLLEDAMRERGARWEEAPLMMPKLVVDGRLITGQNPYSTAAVAEAIVIATGRVPVERTPWRGEATMTLVERLLAGGRDAVNVELAANSADYHVDLIGLLGYYQLQGARDAAAVRDALSIMEIAEPYMPAPLLQVGIAEGHWRLVNGAAGRERRERVLATHPDLAEAAVLSEKFELQQ